MRSERRSKIFSFLNPFAKPAASAEEETSNSHSLHDLTLSGPIPLEPSEIPLPATRLGRGPSGATSTSSCTIPPYEPQTYISRLDGRYPIQERSHVPETPATAGLPSHVSLSTMGFGNSPFKLPFSDYSGMPGRDASHGVGEFGQFIGASSHANPLDSSAPRQPTTPNGLSCSHSSRREIPTLASAIQIHEALQKEASSAKDGPVGHQNNTSTWRGIPRSISRTSLSLFDTWSHSKSRSRRGTISSLVIPAESPPPSQSVPPVVPQDVKAGTTRVRRKMSIDNLVRSLSRQSLFRPSAQEQSMPSEMVAPDNRRWTAVYSEASDDSISQKLHAGSASDERKTSRFAMPQMRSMRSKFSVGRRDSAGLARRSILEMGTGRNGSIIRVSALFQRPEDASVMSDTDLANRKHSEVLELSEVQDTVEITKTPTLSVETSPPRPAVIANLVQPNAAAAVSSLTVALSPARDDVSILDPCRSPLIVPPPDTMLRDQARIRHSIALREPFDLPAVTPIQSKNPHLTSSMPPSESQRAILSTAESSGTLSDLASTDSSASLAAKMKQSLSELKSAFKRMRNMSDLDLSSVVTSIPSSEHDSVDAGSMKQSSSAGNEEILHITNLEEDLNEASPPADKTISHSVSVSIEKKAGSIGSADVALADAGGEKMSCAPSGTSWHTAREDLRVSIADLTSLAWEAG